GQWAAGSSDAACGGPRRDDAGLAQRDRERAQRDLAGVDLQHAIARDGRREAVHAPRGRPVLGAGGLDPEAVVARPVAGALEPEVLDARVGPAAEVRAALVERPDVEGPGVVRRVRA